MRRKAPLWFGRLAGIRSRRQDNVIEVEFEDGSKVVINSHRMLCANQQQMTQSMPVLTEGEPIR